MIRATQTAKGRKVSRVFGWDTHPAAAEARGSEGAGIDSVDQIEKMGIDKFNDACRASVLIRMNGRTTCIVRPRWVDASTAARL